MAEQPARAGAGLVRDGHAGEDSKGGEDEPATARERTRRRAERIRRAELREARSKLEARGSLDPDQRAALEAMTEELVAGLVALFDGDGGSGATYRRLFDRDRD